jgi:hypothetical protein
MRAAPSPATRQRSLTQARYGGIVSQQREFLIKFVSGTIFGVLWPERMAHDRRRRQSPKGIAATALIDALAP